MFLERTVEFESGGLTPQRISVEWPESLPLPKEPNLPKGSVVIEMPNTVYKGVAKGPIGEFYYCIEGRNGYEWILAEEDYI